MILRFMWLLGINEELLIETSPMKTRLGMKPIIGLEFARSMTKDRRSLLLKRTNQGGYDNA
jgi:hypothetical protein